LKAASSTAGDRSKIRTTVSDYRDIELERQNSVFSSVLYTIYNNHKINIIDTPGFDDFVGEVISALKVTDAAVSIVNAQNGVEPGTETTWRQCARVNMPVIFAINHLEHDNSNFDDTVNQLKHSFGNAVTVVQYPLHTGHGFNSIIDLMKMKMFKYAEGGKVEIVDIPAGEKGKAEDLQSKLIEELAANDESLMEIFFENGTLTEEEMSKGLRLGVRNRGIFPVLCINAKQNMGWAA